MTKILKEYKIMIWDECTMAHMHIVSTWPDIERSVQWLKMLWRRNDFIAWRFSPNSASHSKMWMALCEETSTDNNHESCIAEWSLCWRFILVIFYYRWWLCSCQWIERINIISSEFLQCRFTERWAHQQSVLEHHS